MPILPSKSSQTGTLTLHSTANFILSPRLPSSFSYRISSGEVSLLGSICRPAVVPVALNDRSHEVRIVFREIEPASESRERTLSMNHYSIICQKNDSYAPCVLLAVAY